MEHAGFLEGGFGSIGVWDAPRERTKVQYTRSSRKDLSLSMTLCVNSFGVVSMGRKQTRGMVKTSIQNARQKAQTEQEESKQGHR